VSAGIGVGASGEGQTADKVEVKSTYARRCLEVVLAAGDPLLDGRARFVQVALQLVQVDQVVHVQARGHLRRHRRARALLGVESVELEGAVVVNAYKHLEARA